MLASTAARRLTDTDGAETLNLTKGFSVSDNQSPSPGAESPFTPPPPPAPLPPAPAPALRAQPVPPAPQPTQSFPGAVPTYAPPPAPAYGVQPITAPPSGYAPPPTQPGYGMVAGQPGYAPYAAPGHPVAPTRPTSGLAITSLICGLAGAVLFWAFIPVLASIAAVITGHMALGQTKRDPAIGGRGMAIAGLILGYVVIGVGAFTVVSTIISFVFLGAFSLPFMFSS